MDDNYSPYKSWGSLQNAITVHARKLAASDPSQNVSDRVRVEMYNRFLARIFASPQASNWVLKGGAGLIARVVSARRTLDIDMLSRVKDIDDAVDELRALAAEDGADYIEFRYVDKHKLSMNEKESYTEGMAVKFDAFAGGRKVAEVKVDVVTGSIMTAEPDVLVPAHALPFGDEPPVPYLVYPVVDHIADKVCATFQTHVSGVSSREKDLVDLVIFAQQFQMDGDALIRAIRAESTHSQTVLPARFSVPAGWGARYRKLAEPIPACRDYLDVDDAERLAAQLIDPALDGSAAGRVWIPGYLRWEQHTGGIAGSGLTPNFSPLRY